MSGRRGRVGRSAPNLATLDCSRVRAIAPAVRPVISHRNRVKTATLSLVQLIRKMPNPLTTWGRQPHRQLVLLGDSRRIIAILDLIDAKINTVVQLFFEVESMGKLLDYLWEWWGEKKDP